MANNTFTLTDEQLYWLQVALENSKLSAQRMADQGDEDDLRDTMTLIDAYNELEAIIGTPPDILLVPPTTD